MTMPASKWDLACEHLNALQEASGAEAPVDDVPAASGESVDLFAPDAAERLGLTLMQGGA